MTPIFDTRRTRRRGRRLARRLAATSAAALVVLGTPVAASQAAPTRHSPEAVAMAADQGISPATAETRLSWQAALPALAADAEASLGTSYGGIWVDPGDGDRIKVGVVGGSAATSSGTSRVAVLAQKRGVGAAVDAVPVQRSFAELTAASDWLGKRIVTAVAGTPSALGSGLRPDRNTVLLHLPAATPLTARESAVVAEAKQRFGSALEIVHDGTVGVGRACQYPFCDPPLRAGVRIFSGSHGCTAAFLGRSRNDGALYQFTAGHCRWAAETWGTRFASNGSAHTIGPIHNYRWDSGGDMAIIRVDNPAGWQARAWTYVTGSPDTTYDAEYRISADGSSSMNQRVCTTGGSYGRTDCGRVTELDHTQTYCVNNGAVCRTVNGLGRASFCGIGGDSGAPVYANHTALGIQVSGHSTCDSTYQGIQGAQSNLRVNVSHEG